MKRPHLVWLVFSACALVGLGVLGWFSREMLRMERGAQEARRIAAREESVRLALWRMDSALATVHGLEAARPAAEYAPFSPAPATYDAGLVPITGRATMLPSPLLGYMPPFVRLHIQIDPDGTVTSPQALSGAELTAALASGISPATLETASARLAELRSDGGAEGLAAAVIPSRAIASDKLGRDFRTTSRNEAEKNQTAFAAASAPEPVAQQAAVEIAPAPVVAQQLKSEEARQQFFNDAEQQKRSTLLTQNYIADELAQRRAVEEERKSTSSRFRSLVSRDAAAKQTADSSPEDDAKGFAESAPALAKDNVAVRGDLSIDDATESTAAAGLAQDDASSAPRFDRPKLEIDAPAAPEPAGARAAPSTPPAIESPVAAEGPLQALWSGDELFFARRVEVGERTIVQGVWLDWPELRAWLLARVTDLLPEARLEPTAADAAFGEGEAARRLAFLPVRLVPGAAPFHDSAHWSPLRISLATAWGFAALGVLALALLLRGTLQLSERRATFVSAVTHELRTPLTTFRMYTEMLSGGMVPDETRRHRYLDTLRKESERLSHLVENVLSYARLERGRASQRIEDTTPGELLARIEERLRQRAEQGGLAFSIAFAENAADLPLHLDVTAAEQVLFNLVDNAAKYARRNDGGAGTLAISVERSPSRHALFRIIDNGPGIAASVRKRLFQPFSKSAAEAAHSQPGVGLGLALSRRLARDELHGELSVERTGPDGTVFRLEV